jgi:hypothetical protein
MKPGNKFPKGNSLLKISIYSLVLSLMLSIVPFVATLEQYFLIATGLMLAWFVYIIKSGKGHNLREGPFRNWYEVVTSSIPSSSLQRRQRVFIIVLFVVIIMLNLYAPANPSLTQRILASCIIILVTIPAWRYFSGRDRATPFLLFFGGIYTVYYALPIFLLEEYSRAYPFTRVIPDVFVERALFLALVGLSALFIGYYAVASKVYFQTVPKISLIWKNFKILKLIAGFFGCVGVLIYFVNMAVKFPLSIQQAINFLGNLSMISIAIFFILQLTGHLGMCGRGFLWIILIPIRVIAGMGTGATFQIIVVPLLLVIIYSTLKHRITWRVIVIVGIALAILRPAQIEFRELTWGGVAADVSPIEKAALYIRTTKNVLTGESISYSDAVGITVSRLSYLMTFAEVIELTPATVPYWRGVTYYPLLFKLIPRFFYPDKPLDETGQYFGHLYGFLNPSDATTSYNLSQLVEFYANFGVIGILLGMFLLGLLYRTLQHVFIHPSMGIGSVVAYTYIFTLLVDIESGLSALLGGLLWTFVFLGIIHLTIKKAEQLGKPV